MVNIGQGKPEIYHLSFCLANSGDLKELKIPGVVKAVYIFAGTPLLKLGI